jgi:hypothetical protein
MNGKIKTRRWNIQVHLKTEGEMRRTLAFPLPAQRGRASPRR